MQIRTQAWQLAIGVLAVGLAPALAHASPTPPDSKPAFYTLPPEQHCTDHFLLHHSSAKGFVTELGDVLESLYGRYLTLSQAAGLLPRTPTGPMRWLCVDRPEDLGPNLDGLAATEHFHQQAFYSSQADTVVLAREWTHASKASHPGLPIAAYTRCVSHELAHQLSYRSGLQTPGVMYAFWISEGLAMNFETSDAREGEFGSANLPRQQRLLSAYWSGRLPDLADFVCLTASPTDQSLALDAYAKAWGLVQFLHQRNPAALRRYLQSLALRPPGRRPPSALAWEFENAFGTMDTVRTDWLAYLQQLSSVANTSAPAP